MTDTPGAWINTNARVTVFLTEAGADAINRRYDKFNSLFPGIMDPPSKQYVEGDQYETQFWQLMQDFGGCIGGFRPIPFVENRVYFADCFVAAAAPTPLPLEDDDERP